MGKIKVEDIRGYELEDGRVICADCIADEIMTEEAVITEQDVEKQEYRYFCDKCGQEFFEH